MEREQRMPHLAKPKSEKRGSGKVVLLLLILFAAVLLILFFRSDLSKIHAIDVTGIRHTPLSDVGQAIGVAEGDSFFAASARTLLDRAASLPCVKEVRVEKKFPGQIRIEITEFPEVAYVLKPDGKLGTLLANGTEVPTIEGEPVRNLPILSGWENAELTVKMAEALAELPVPLLADISQITPEPADAWPDRIRMYTRSYFEVVTTIGYLPDRLDYMRAIIDDYEPGIITMLEANTHMPYPEEEAPPEDGRAQSGEGDGGA